MVDSAPPADVFVRGARIGATPVRLAVDYQENARIETRRISYFRTEPLKATLIAIASLGLTIPFNLLPTDSDSRIVALGSYNDNEIRLEFRLDGYAPETRSIALQGEPEIAVQAALVGVSTGSLSERRDLP